MKLSHRMYISIKVAALTMLLSPFSQAFDGDITTRTTMGDQIIISTYVAKGNKMKFDIPQRQTTIVLDASRNQRIVIDHAAKQYFVEVIDPNAPGQPQGKIEDTGETSEILGYPVRKLIFKEDSGQKYEIWATSSIENQALTSMPGMSTSMKEQVKGIFNSTQVFPMKMIVYKPNGKTQMTMEVTAVTERNVADFEITLPRTYEENYLVPESTAPTK